MKTYFIEVIETRQYFLQYEAYSKSQAKDTILNCYLANGYLYLPNRY
jgi:hypothetical protein